jgi:hypothetical protein
VKTSTAEKEENLKGSETILVVEYDARVRTMALKALYNIQF